MNNAWTGIHWRGVAVAIVAIGVVAGARAGNDGARFTPPLERAQASLRELPPATGSLTTDARFASRSGDFDKRLASCAAQSGKDQARDAQCALASTITTTTARVVDRNAAHAMVIADARR